MADVDEIRYFGHAERPGYYSVWVTDTIFLSRARHVVPEGSLSAVP